MSLHEPPPDYRLDSSQTLGQADTGAVRQLPVPGPDAVRHSERLIETIKQRIQAAQGTISFSEYMALALMAPGLGYYSAGNEKFGAAGDFITAAETSILFARSIARQCQQVLAALPGEDATTILEIGAGSGRLAAGILSALEVTQTLPDQYWILEPSADLQRQQRPTLEKHVPHLCTRVQWLAEMPTRQIKGVILGNEVLDVLPVSLFEMRNGEVRERAVCWGDDRLQWHSYPASERLREAVTDLELAVNDQYQSEINLSLPAWMNSVADALVSGLVLLIDYGYPRHEYYHPQRDRGTLMCHYRHRAHADPFVYPGLQDITAHVDFTAVAEAGAAAHLHVAGYNTQAQFLLGCGIESIAQSIMQSMTSSGETADASEYTPQGLELAQQIKRLTLPGEMGEIFKVIALTREFDEPLLGFTLFDMRGKL